MDRLTNWIELPAQDLSRARAFYEAVLEVTLVEARLGDLAYAFFPAKDPHNTGALVAGPGYAPSSTGPVVYLDGHGRFDAILARVVAAGGTIVMPRTFLSPEAGDVAFFVDTEGNRVGLQAAVPDEAPVDDATMQRLLGGATREVAFVVKRGPAYDDPASAPLQWEHARNMFHLLKTGRLRSVTALVDGTDVLGLGVLRAADRAEAERLLADDPGVRGGRLAIELLTSVTFREGDRL